jgi:hypothetical protein
MTDPIRDLKFAPNFFTNKFGLPIRTPKDVCERLLNFATPSPDALVTLAHSIRRRHCLATIAAELGFASWQQMKAVLTGEEQVRGFGTILYPNRCNAHLNLWCKTYPEADAMRKRGRIPARIP